MKVANCPYNAGCMCVDVCRMSPEPKEPYYDFAVTKRQANALAEVVEFYLSNQSFPNTADCAQFMELQKRLDKFLKETS